MGFGCPSVPREAKKMEERCRSHGSKQLCLLEIRMRSPVHPVSTSGRPPHTPLGCKWGRMTMTSAALGRWKPAFLVRPLVFLACDDDDDDDDRRGALLTRRVRSHALTGVEGTAERALIAQPDFSPGSHGHSDRSLPFVLLPCFLGERSAKPRGHGGALCACSWGPCLQAADTVLIQLSFAHPPCCLLILLLCILLIAGSCLLPSTSFLYVAANNGLLHLDFILPFLHCNLVLSVMPFYMRAR
jgi:hypothetical protein